MHASENMLIFSMAGVCAIVLGLIAYFAFIVLKMRKAQLKLIAQRQEATLSAADEQRQLVALDLHDDLLPILAASRFKVSAIDLSDERGLQLQEDAINHIHEVAKRIRNWANQLAPPAVIQQQSPLHQLEEYVRKIAGDCPIDISIRDFDLPALSGEQSIHLHRILQEIIHNAVRHSNAKGLLIYGLMKKKFLVVTAIDDGVGFNVNEAKKRSRGIGLQNMWTRARLLKAHLTIESRAGEGSRHTIILPF